MAAPLQTALITPFPFGISSFGMPVIGDDVPTTGRVFFVDSTSPNRGDDTQHGSSPLAPFQTLDFAIGQCTANRGDRIYLCPGHTEDITSAAGVNCDVAGVQIFGMGSGRDRARFTFKTTTAASLDINAASVWLRNIVFDLTGIDNLTVGINVKASDCTISECEFILATAAGQCNYGLLTDVNAHRFRFLGNLLAGSNNAGCAVGVYIGTDTTTPLEDVEVGWNRIVGNFSGACVYLGTGTDGWLQNVFVHDNTLVTLGVGQTCLIASGNVVSGVGTGVIAGNACVGSVISTLMQINTSLAPYPAAINNYGYDSDTPNVNGVIVPVVGSQLGTARSLVDEIIGAEFSYNRANYIAVSVDFSSGTWNTSSPGGTSHEILTVTGAVRLRIIPICSTNLTSGASPTISLGYEGAVTAFIAATTLTDIDADEIWLSATPAAYYNKTSVIDVVLTGGKDVGFDLVEAASAPATGGIVVFHCWWEPINSTGAVVAGAGGSL